MEAVVFIYIKDNEIKVLDSSYGKQEFIDIENDGFKLKSTLRCTTFIKYLYDNTIDNNIKQILNGE